MSQVTDLIKRLRALPMTQSEIARRTGIPQPRISRWESGDVSTSADDALKLADLLRSASRKRKPSAATT